MGQEVECRKCRESVELYLFVVLFAVANHMKSYIFGCAIKLKCAD